MEGAPLIKFSGSNMKNYRKTNYSFLLSYTNDFQE